MYRVIVIDDEPLIARSIKQIINKTNPSFEVIAIAYDGLSGLAKIEEMSPDVVFTDIKMPIMDGLELVKEINTHYPNIKTVIISGYDEFEYAKTAMREGVIDYLLKPMNRERLSELLTNIEKQLDLSYHVEQLDLWNSIIHHPDKIIDQRKVERYLPYNAYLLLMTCKGSYAHTASELSQSTQMLWKSNTFYNGASDHISYNPFWVVNGSKPNIKILIIGCDETELPALEKVVHDIHDSFDHSIPITSIVKSFSGSAANIYPTIMQVNRYLIEMLVYAHSLFHIWDGTLKNIAPSTSHSFLSDETKKYMTVLFEQKQLDNLFDRLNELMSSWETEGIKQIVLEEYMKQILQLFLDCIQIPQAIFEYQNTTYDLLANNTDYVGLTSDFDKVIMELFTLKTSFDHRNHPQNIVLQQVKDYIDDNYTNPINVQTIASKFGIVAPYHSKLYVDYFGQSIKKYILDLRISKAETLLKTSPPLPLRKIADLTGFNDQFYFSKVFKQQLKMTPVEFRKMVNNELIN